LDHVPAILDKLLRIARARSCASSSCHRGCQRIEDDFRRDDRRGAARHDAELKERLAAGESLDESCGGVPRPEASRRVPHAPFDVQVTGGAALHMGNIAEMKTGEGKRWCRAAVVPQRTVGNGVHVVTYDYLPSTSPNDGPRPQLPRPEVG